MVIVFKASCLSILSHYNYKTNKNNKKVVGLFCICFEMSSLF